MDESSWCHDIGNFKLKFLNYPKFILIFVVALQKMAADVPTLDAAMMESMKEAFMSMV